MAKFWHLGDRNPDLHGRVPFSKRMRILEQIVAERLGDTAKGIRLCMKSRSIMLEEPVRLKAHCLREKKLC